MVRRMKQTVSSALLALLILTGSVGAVALSDQVVQQLKASGQFDEYIAHVKQLRAAGMDQPPSLKDNQSLALSRTTGEHGVLVILIDFPDKPYTAGYAAASTDMFDSLLFSENHKNPTGSMREYYLEDSYGLYQIHGVVAGWYRAGYAHQVYNGLYDVGEPISLTPADLVREAVQDADAAGVDFSQFDNGDGTMNVIVIHAGSGYEESGDKTEIHSHMSVYPDQSAIYNHNMHVRYYTVQPEESAGNHSMSGIGVFCHEWGHTLGLPDLYDTDYSSMGLGKWSLMASGNYNGASKSPAHMDAWCKKYLSWILPTRLMVNTPGVQIPAVEYNPVAYLLNLSGRYGNEYWLVENREKVGFDAQLPGSGLCIYHIDEDMHDNTNDWSPLVLLEQADGNFDLQYNHNGGDGSDPFPNQGLARDFNDKTIPDSKYYGGVSSQVAAWNISDADSVMTADFDVVFSRPFISTPHVVFSDVAYGNHNTVLEAGEKIQVLLTLTDEWAAASDISVTMTTDNPALTVTQNFAGYGSLGTDSSATNTAVPFEFQIPSPVASRIDSFYFDVTANGGAYHTVLGAEATIGKPQILIVDADGNDPANLEQFVQMPLYKKRVPAAVWNRTTQESPFVKDLKPYPIVIWMTGNYRTGLVDAVDIDGMKGYLNLGGNLLLTGQGIARQINAIDTSFLHNYLKVNLESDVSVVPVDTATDGPVSSGLIYVGFNSGTGSGQIQAYDHLTAVNGGQAEWRYFGKTNYAGVSYSGSYKTVFFAFGMENIRPPADNRFTTSDMIISHVIDFFGQVPTDVNDGNDYAVNLPAMLKLEQNSPNPFNPTTRISYTITGSHGGGMNPTRLEIFNLLGQRIATLVDGVQGPGQYEVTWDGKDYNHQQVASGVYFYRLTRANLTESKKMVLLK